MVRPLIVTNANRASMLMSDESKVYTKLGKEFANHGAVDHSANEYARLGCFIHINTAENFYSILNRGIYGIYHHVSEAHLHRYRAEFDFRYNSREVTDGERTVQAVRKSAGKRLHYRDTKQP